MIVSFKYLGSATWFVAVAIALSALSSYARAGNTAAPDQEAADDGASESLDEELLKELEDASPAKQKEDTEPPEAKPGARKPEERVEKEADALDEELMRELGDGETPSADEEDPLGRVARTMREVEGRLTRSKSGNETRELQTKIVTDLDKMIEEALKQAKRSKSKSSGSSGGQQARRSKPDQAQQGVNKQSQQQGDKPSSDSTERLGADRALRPDPGQVREMMKHLWGHLPEREREMMLNASIEQFLPKYELLIEQYFRRLAEEQQSK